MRRWWALVTGTLLLVMGVAGAQDPLPLVYDGVHDPESAALRVLQQPAEAFETLLKDDKGRVDWMASLDAGVIEPRTDIFDKEKMVFIDMNIIMKNTASMPYVTFQHKTHTQWMTCSNCHVEIFLPQKGANVITMAGIIEGRACGACHGRVAFEPSDCERCHNESNPTGGLW